MDRRYSPSIIVATFNASDKEVKTFLREHGWYGYLIQGVIPRYAIEVPFKKESEAKKILEESLLVEKVFKPISGRPVNKLTKKERPSWMND